MESLNCDIAAGLTAEPPRGPLPAPLIPVRRVVLLSVISGGLYLYYWFYLTWKHYRDHTGAETYPVWHALTLLVPIYGLFRTHAHMRAFRDLLTGRLMPTTINPWGAVLMVLAGGLPGALEFAQPWAGSPTRETALMGLTATALTTAFVCWILGFVQAEINSYWRVAFAAGRPGPARIGVGEVVITAVGFLGLVNVVFAVASSSQPEGRSPEDPIDPFRQARPALPAPPLTLTPLSLPRSPHTQPGIRPCRRTGWCPLGGGQAVREHGFATSRKGSGSLVIPTAACADGVTSRGYSASPI